jgi:hypothetical protein
MTTPATTPATTPDVLEARYIDAWGDERFHELFVYEDQAFDALQRYVAWKYPDDAVTLPPLRLWARLKDPTIYRPGYRIELRIGRLEIALKEVRRWN